MNDRCRYELTSYLNEIKAQHTAQSSRLQQLGGYSSCILKVKHHKNGKDYYSVYDPSLGRYRYLGTEKNLEVSLIKEAHYLELYEHEIEREIRVIENVLSSSGKLSYDTVNSKLKTAYRNAQLSYSSAAASPAQEWKRSMERFKKAFPTHRPEELIHKTRDGNYVRSKGEALIYNYLLEMGVTFIYELPLKIRINNKESLLIPDFTILSEIDHKSVIIIEHQGMMNDPGYRNKFNDKVYKYWLNNIIPERDVFFTFDLPNGGFDDTPIRNIIRQYILP